ncbi:hypothetical protein ILUMI_09418 [Ignelater luminosus]|uniref:Leucine-rich repeat-containing protein 58 n=1 Tax=Ignelater luminosus TaxID=2038154 RepID=A0A8K0GG04_IGNLU|nr:hypothetical protein ILUMI_09418 [Ignelater luminosus]
MENYTSDSSDSDSNNRVLDFGYQMLDTETMDRHLDAFVNDEKKTAEQIEVAILNNNQLNKVSESIFKFSNLKTLDLSSNGLSILPDVFRYCPITTLIAKNNNLTNKSLPKTFTQSSKLREMNLSGNQLTMFPEQLLDFPNMKYLYLGSNQILNISKNIGKLKNLQILSLGGNELKEVPITLGQLHTLQALVLCDNKIESLPANIANLKQLKSLLLHKNCLRTLPPAIIGLKNLTELSLRDNPLVVRFVSDMTYNPGSLLELTARTIKIQNVPVEPGDVPSSLLKYLKSGHRCVNPQCKGVFFDNRVEHIKFVDFCGKYRIPLLQYLCSSKCIEDRNEDVRPGRSYMMKKVLLG